MEDYPQGHSSPNPDIIDDFVVQIFGRMENQRISVFDPYPVGICTLFKYEEEWAIPTMPNLLQKIEQAQMYLDLNTRRMIHFNSLIHVPRTQPANLDNPITTEQLLDLFSPYNKVNHNLIPSIKPGIPLAQIGNIVSSQIPKLRENEVISELTAWAQTTYHLLLTAISDYSQDFMAALEPRNADLIYWISSLFTFFSFIGPLINFFFLRT